MASYGIYSGPSGLGYSPYGGAQPPQYGAQQGGGGNLGMMSSGLSQGMPEAPKQQTNNPYQNNANSGLSANGGSGGSQQYIPGYSVPGLDNVNGQISMPTVQSPMGSKAWGAGRSVSNPNAATSAGVYDGLQDWQVNYMDARRPQGFAAAGDYDQSMRQNFQNFNSMHGNNFVPYAYGQGGQDPRTMDAFGGSSLNGGRRGPGGPQMAAQNTFDQFGNATVGGNIDPIYGNRTSGRYLPTIDPTQNGAIDRSYYDYNFVNGPGAQGAQDALRNGNAQYFENSPYGGDQANLTNLMARNYLTLKPYYPNLSFDQYVSMYQQNFAGQQQAQRPSPNFGV